MAEVQLKAYGVSDIWLENRGPDPGVCANMRDSMMYWFVNRKDGFPLYEDLSPTDPFATTTIIEHGDKE